ncbi:hypothetical protein K0651_06965 [Ornithinimicrobium sp. Arc0846-15]|nr:hypothetical protein [Ornithinimicrobium laminariae]
MTLRPLCAAISSTLILTAACSGSEAGSESGSGSAETASDTSSATSSGPTEGKVADEWTTPAEVLWTNDEVLMSDVRVQDDVALAYVQTGNNAEAVVAWNAESGEELWRSQAIPGSNAAGVAQSIPLVEIDGAWTTAFLAPTEDVTHNWGTLRVVDIHTGDSDWSGLDSIHMESSRPEQCGDTYCLTALFDYSIEATGRQFDYAGKGALVPIDAIGADGDQVPYLEQGRFLGTYVSSTQDWSGETLNYGADGRIVWSRPYTEVFGPGTTSNAGWTWSDSDQELPVIGLGFQDTGVDLSQTATATVDLTTPELVGLDRETGETLWSMSSVMQCRSTGDSLRPDKTEDTLVFCRYNSGSASYTFDGEDVSEPAFTDIDVDLIGVDPFTGDIEWTVPLGPDPLNYAAARDSGLDYSVSGGVLAVVEGGLADIDASTGDVKPLPAGASVLCALPEETAKLSGAWRNGEPWGYARADQYRPCDSSGLADPSTQVTVGALRTSGFADDSIAVVNLESGVTAFAPAEASP